MRLGASLGLVALAPWLDDAAEVGARLAGAALGSLALAAVLLTGQTVLMALRWRLTAARLGLAIGRRRAIGEYCLAQAVNVTLPGGVLSDAARAVRSRDGVGLARAAHAVIVERMAGQAAIAAVALTGFSAALASPGGIAWAGWSSVALAGAVLAATAAAATLLAARRVKALAAFGRSVRATLLIRDALPAQAALGLPIVALNPAAFVACARATGTTLGLEAATTVVPSSSPRCSSCYRSREGAGARARPDAPTAGGEATFTCPMVGRGRDADDRQSEQGRGARAPPRARLGRRRAGPRRVRGLGARAGRLGRAAALVAPFGAVRRQLSGARAGLLGGAWPRRGAQPRRAERASRAAGGRGHGPVGVSAATTHRPPSRRSRRSGSSASRCRRTPSPSRRCPSAR